MIKFDTTTHTYTLNDKVLISTTQLLKKVGLAPSYDIVDSDVLERAAEKGTLIHNEIESYIKNGEVGFTDELSHFIDWIKISGVDTSTFESEKMVHSDDIAGTIDLIYKLNGKTFIADFKTTSVFHKNTVEWQLSIYAYLYDKDNYENTVIKGFHFKPELNIIELKLKPKAEVEKLIDCYKKDIPYYECSNLLPIELQTELMAVENEFVDMETIYKQIKAKRESVIAKIKDAMESNNITSVETSNFKITYVKAREQIGVDSKRLIADNPDLAKEYEKITNVNSSLRITTKGVKDE